MTALLTLAEAAEKLRISAADPARAVKRLIRKHGTPYRRLGAQWVLTETDLNALVNACCRLERETAAGMSEGRSGSAVKRFAFRNTAPEQLSERLRKVTERGSKEKPRRQSFTVVRSSDGT